MNPNLGTAVIIDPACARRVERTVFRSWRERLLTLPWRPLQATRVEVTFEPLILRVEPHKFVVHPSLQDELIRILGMKVAQDDRVPEDEIHLKQDGRTIGRITGLGK